MAVLSQSVLEGIRTAKVNDYTPLPEGEYTVTVDKADLKTTKDGQGNDIVSR